jgi:chemotaxis protein CheD
VPTQRPMDSPDSLPTISVAIGQWVVAAAPVRIRTLLGSCVGVVLYHRAARLGGLAHIVLPRACGAVDHPGKYADMAIPTMLAEFNRQLEGKLRSRLTAKLVGGANMFQVDATAQENSGLNIGQRNQEAVEQILNELTIPILARDMGGASGRRVTLDTSSGIVTIKVPGGVDYEL